METPTVYQATHMGTDLPSVEDIPTHPTFL